MGVSATVKKVEFGDPKKTETENRVFKISWNRNLKNNTLKLLKETELLNHEIDIKILKSM